MAAWTVGVVSVDVDISADISEARQRLSEFGPNAITEEAPPPWRSFLAKLWAPVAWMLEAALLLEIGLGSYVEAAVIGALLLFKDRPIVKEKRHAVGGEHQTGPNPNGCFLQAFIPR